MYWLVDWLHIANECLQCKPIEYMLRHKFSNEAALPRVNGEAADKRCRKCPRKNRTLGDLSNKLESSNV